MRSLRFFLFLAGGVSPGRGAPSCASGGRWPFFSDCGRLDLLPGLLGVPVLLDRLGLGPRSAARVLSPCVSRGGRALRSLRGGRGLRDLEDTLLTTWLSFVALGMVTGGGLGRLRRTGGVFWGTAGAVSPAVEWAAGGWGEPDAAAGLGEPCWSAEPDFLRRRRRRRGFEPSGRGACGLDSGGGVSVTTIGYPRWLGISCVGRLTLAFLLPFSCENAHAF